MLVDWLLCAKMSVADFFFSRTDADVIELLYKLSYFLSSLGVVLLVVYDEDFG